MKKIKGIDVSYCQKKLNFAEVKKTGNEFVIIRAGISTRKDTLYETNLNGAQENNLKYGFYWYSKAFDIETAKSEAKKCIETISGTNPELPVFYDMEEHEQLRKLTNKQRTDIIIAFCTVIKNAGYKAGVYISPIWLLNYVDKTEILNNYPIWLAHWTGDPDMDSKYKFNQQFWQWGVVNIGGVDVDGDVMFDYTDEYIVLKNKPLYGSAYSNTVCGKISGKYYYYDNDIVNRRRRICPNPWHIGKIPVSANVTGWIDV